MSGRLSRSVCNRSVAMNAGVIRRRSDGEVNKAVLRSLHRARWETRSRSAAREWKPISTPGEAAAPKATHLIHTIELAMSGPPKEEVSILSARPTQPSSQHSYDRTPFTLADRRDLSAFTDSTKGQQGASTSKQRSDDCLGSNADSIIPHRSALTVVPRTPHGPALPMESTSASIAPRSTET